MITAPTVIKDPWGMKVTFPEVASGALVRACTYSGLEDLSLHGLALAGVPDRENPDLVRIFSHDVSVTGARRSELDVHSNQANGILLDPANKDQIFEVFCQIVADLKATVQKQEDELSKHAVSEYRPVPIFIGEDSRHLVPINNITSTLFGILIRESILQVNWDIFVKMEWNHREGGFCDRLESLYEDFKIVSRLPVGAVNHSIKKLVEDVLDIDHTKPRPSTLEAYEKAIVRKYGNKADPLKAFVDELNKLIGDDFYDSYESGQDPRSYLMLKNSDKRNYIREIIKNDSSATRSARLRRQIDNLHAEDTAEAYSYEELPQKVIAAIGTLKDLLDKVFILRGSYANDKTDPAISCPERARRILDAFDAEEESIDFEPYRELMKEARELGSVVGHKVSDGVTFGFGRGGQDTLSDPELSEERRLELAPWRLISEASNFRGVFDDGLSEAHNGVRSRGLRMPFDEAHPPFTDPVADRIIEQFEIILERRDPEHAQEKSDLAIKLEKIVFGVCSQL